MTNQEFIESIRLEGEEWLSSSLSSTDYIASSFGRVASLPRIICRKNNRPMTITGKILKPLLGRDGYLYVHLRIKGGYKYLAVHRLVASAFIPNPFKKEEVDHIDTNKLNNNISNLRWCSASENRRNPITLKRIIENTPIREQVPVLAIQDGVVIFTFDSIAEAARAGFSRSGITRCLHYNQKSYRGYEWRIKNPDEKLVSMSKNS